MKQLKKLEVSEDYYDKIIKTQFSNGSIVREHFYGSRTRLYSDNMFIATKCETAALIKGDITDNQFFAFIGQFNKQLYRQLYLNQDLFYLDVQFNGSSRQKNPKAWNALKIGDFFYYIDLDSAYWQVAYKCGYINERMFKKYLSDDRYKQAKRYVISFLGRDNKMRYYNNNDEFYEIVCDRDLFSTIYMNIRYALYNYINDALKEASNWIEYNIDGLAVHNTDVDKIQDYFTRNNLKFKIIECRKLNDREFSYKSKIRLF